MFAANRRGPTYMTTGLILGLALGCAASETDNTGSLPSGGTPATGGTTVQTGSGGNASTAAGGKTDTATGGTATTATGGKATTGSGGKAVGGSTARGGTTGASGATMVTPANCTPGATCLVLSCVNLANLTCTCSNGRVTNNCR